MWGVLTGPCLPPEAYGPTPMKRQVTLHDAMKLGYRLEGLKPSLLAGVSAQMLGRKIITLPVLRKG